MLSQSKYITDLLQKFHMADCKPYLTPMATSPPLVKNSGEPFAEGELYRQLIGGLQYITITRPDLAYSVNKLCQYMHSPSTSHWQALKRVLRYLQHTKLYGLFFSKTSTFDIQCFSDSDWGDVRMIGDLPTVMLFTSVAISSHG